MSDSPTVLHDLPTLPERAPGTHKGHVGRIAIIAGSQGMSGAAVLCALGALRGGAGLVRVYCPAAIQPIVAASEPSIMTVALDPDAAPAATETLLRDAWADVLAIGPGLGQSASSEHLARAAVAAAAGRPTVIDADGLNVLAKGGARAFCSAIRGAESGLTPVPQPGTAVGRVHSSAIITPHPGEMARLREGAGLPPLSGDDDAVRLQVAHEFAALGDLVVVLKGYRTVVCAGSRAFVNATGNPGMATGGMGDVLTGLIAALVGQGLAPFDAARLGVHVHGLAADLCAQEIGPAGYLAREVSERIPAALGHLRRGKMGFR